MIENGKVPPQGGTFSVFSSQSHESEVVFRAADLSVVEAVDVHVHFLNFLGAVIERVCRVDSGCDG